MLQWANSMYYKPKGSGFHLFFFLIEKYSNGSIGVPGFHSLDATVENTMHFFSDSLTLA